MRKYKYLSLDDRKKIEKMYSNGERVADIATTLNASTGTIYRELQKGYTGGIDKNMRPAYDAKIAQLEVQKNFKCRGKKKSEVAIV